LHVYKSHEYHHSVFNNLQLKTLGVAFAEADKLEEQLKALQLPWPEALKLLEMAYLFEEPMKERHCVMQSEDRMREVKTRFGTCWEGLKAFQKHQSGERTGDITVRLYADVQKRHSGVVMFERECSPVLQALQEERGGSQTS
jgi:hypothetical protein